MPRGMTVRLTLAVGLAGWGLARGANPVLRVGTAEEARVSAGRLNSVMTRLQEFTDGGVWVGATALVARNGVIVAHRAFGWADLDNHIRFDPETICQLASVTKPVTAAAAMILVEEGRLGLDDPVERYLPAFRKQQLAAAGKPLGHRAITVRQLLTHTSGLPRDVPSRKVPPAMHREWLGRRLADIGDEAARMDLLFEPGSRFQYSNAGIATMGRVVEAASGQAFDQFVKTRLFDRLGMRESTFQPPASAARRVAALYVDRDGPSELAYRYDPEFRITNPAPNGGLFSTAREMAAFAQMFLNEGSYNGQQILSAGAVRQMLADQTLHLPQVRGLGWSLYPWGLRPVTETVFTHAGSSGTFLWGDARRGVAALLFSQTAGRRVTAAQREFFLRVAAAVDGPGESKPNPLWPRHVVASGYPALTAVAADFTGDGLADVIANGRGQTLLYVAPQWKEVVLDAGPREAIHSEVLDADSDGDPDYVGAVYSPGVIFWLERPPRPLLDRWTYRLVDDQVNGVHGLIAGDIDGDGRADLAANSAQPAGPFPNSLAWFKAPAQPRAAERWHRHVFARGEAPGLSHYLGLGDVNGDGRTDVATAAKIASGGNWFAWWEAPQDPAQAWRKRPIAAGQEGATNILMAEVNGDGRLDFIATRGHGKGVVWFEAPDWKQHEIHADFTGPHSLAVGDIDGDGDIDAAACAKHDFIAAWFENDGRGKFRTHVIDQDQAGYDLRLVDMDRDGDLDVLIAGQESRNVVWYENRVVRRR